MNATEQYQMKQLMYKLECDPQSIGWRDLVGDPRIPHSTMERERLLQRGTTGNQGLPSDPFSGWQRPWFFWTVLKIGALLIGACFALVYGCELLLNTNTQVAVEMLYLIPPMVVPVALMVFFWELNVPRNLTIWELLAFFLVGTLLSLGGNTLMFVVVGTEGGPMAALREEPAKLLAGAALLAYCRSKGKQVCGLTGLAVGAAVGSGFSAFETISYGLHYDLETVMIRVCFAVVGHTLYSCSYLAALALHMPDGRLTTQSFLNQDFLLTFGCSVFCHGLWNSGQIPLGLRFMVTLLLLWFSALWVTRKALAQLRRSSGHRSVVAGKLDGISHIELRCLRGQGAGRKWSYPSSRQITIGRGSANAICLSEGIEGISRSHCYIEARSNGWMVTDVHSTYGTFLQHPGGSICKLVPGKQYPISSGTLLYLGSQNYCLGISVF